ncbi:MAG TPA: BatA domain-containing protein, partial [Pirellulales bacterium]|nr:BatA domain-containing protein [Pirellulales bacterium]
MFPVVNPLLLWGLAIVALPVAIHLINLLRHRRVEWAAMEFLLASQRKNSTWVRLKELLLLALRMAAVAAVVMIVAQPLGCSRLSRLLGGGKTHHIVLLDDGFSMGDRQADVTAFDKAREVVGRIGDDVARQPTSQTFTLLRFSRARLGRSGTQPDLQAAKVTTDFGARLKELLKPLAVSQLAVGPAPALEAIEQLVGDVKGEDRVVYLVSDFRANEWAEPDELAKTLARLDAAKAQLRLINCVDGPHANLAISALKPGAGTRAAGV